MAYIRMYVYIFCAYNTYIMYTALYMHACIYACVHAYSYNLHIYIRWFCLHKLLYVTVIFLLKEERLSNEYDEVPDNSVRNSVAYTASPQIPAKEKDTIATTSNTAPADAKEQELHYDYAATGISVRKFTCVAMELLSLDFKLQDFFIGVGRFSLLSMVSLLGNLCM